MQTIAEIRALLAERGLRPRSRLGQNFLHDGNQVRRLVEAAAPTPGEVILEVGPGTGVLTEALLERGVEVVACELDLDLAQLLEDRLGDRVRLVRGDCLDRHRVLAGKVKEAIGDRSWRLVANLPFGVASTLIVELLLHHPRCLSLHVTIQREVARRLTSPPGTKAYGQLTIIVSALAEVRAIGDVPASCFWPVPKVDSAMVGIHPRADHGLDDPAGLARFVVRLFSSRRKQLGTILGRAPVEAAGIDPQRRPDVLAVDEFVHLWRTVPRSD